MLTSLIDKYVRKSPVLSFTPLFKEGSKKDWKKPADWSDIRKDCPANSIALYAAHKADFSAYDNLGFTATCTGGYNVFIDGTQYGSTYASGATCTITWSTSGITTGDDITTPSVMKAHKIWIEPATEGNDITAFHCARVAANGTEQQGVLWGHFNLVNAINLSKGFAYTEYYNDLLTAVTAKKNLITANGLDYCFDNALSLKYLPKIDYSNVSDLTNFVTKASNLNINIDTSKNNTITKIGCYGTSQYSMTNFKELRVSNEAPFNNSTSPQINISYTAMDHSALVQLFNDLPYNVGYTVEASPTISNGIATGFSQNDFLRLIPKFEVEAGEDFEIFLKIKTPVQFPTYSSGLFSLGYDGDTYGSGIMVYSSGKLSYSGCLGSIVMNNPLNINTDYYVKFSRTNGITYLAYSIDKQNWITKNGTSASTNDAYKQQLEGTGYGCIFGKRSAYNTTSYFTGSIDLNETYIKINDVYWFRGQPAMTKTLSCVGATGTADLTADDKDIALNKGWSLTLS